MARPLRRDMVSRQLDSLKKLEDQLARCGSPDVTQLEAVWDNLDGQRIPTTGEPGLDDLAPVFLAIASLRVVHGCTRRFSDNAQVKSDIDLHLLDICEWADFMLAHAIDKDAYSVALPCGSTVQIVCSLMTFICQDVPLIDCALSIGSILNTIIYCWMEADGPEQQNVLSLLLNTILEPSGRIAPIVLDAFLLAANYRHRAVARKAWGNLGVQLDMDTLDVPNICNDLTVIIRLSHQADQPMLDSFMASGGAKIMLRCITALNDPQNWMPRDATLHLRALVLCYRFLGHGCTHSSNDFKWILQMVKGGILEAIPSSAELPGVADQKELLDCLIAVIDAVMLYMIYRRLIRGVARSLVRNPPPPRVIAPLQGKWSALLKLSEKRAAEKKAFDANDRERCHFCNRHTSDQAWPMRTCSACKSTRYCSEECQRKHWRFHRPACLDYQADIINAPLPLHDQAFICYLSERAISSRINEVRTIIMSKPDLTAPICDLIVNVNWRTLPARLGALSLTFVLNDSEVEDWHAMEDHENRVNLAVVIPWGLEEAILRHVMIIPAGLQST